ncbi:MAG: YiiX/YebB-like N1pC/P60 family cysteine hydrolase [Clostridia bacterium]|nr:YiiX/YebB-like N1pC/P60 family cysteine hydrolase [Clostridia bacterium]
MNLEVGDIVLVKPKSLLSRIICKFTNSKYSHACIVYSSSPTPLILDIDYNMSKIRRLDYYNERGYDIFRLREGLSEDEKIALQVLILNYLDKEYDYKQLLSYLRKLFFHKDIINNPKKFICSELVFQLYYELGYNLNPSAKILGDITPHDISNSTMLTKIKMEVDF